MSTNLPVLVAGGDTRLSVISSYRTNVANASLVVIVFQSFHCFAFLVRFSVPFASLFSSLFDFPSISVAYAHFFCSLLSIKSWRR